MPRIDDENQFDEDEQDQDGEMDDDGDTWHPLHTPYDDQNEQIDDMDIVPNSKPPIVPEEGTYLTALNEAGVDPQRIEQLKQSKFLFCDCWLIVL